MIKGIPLAATDDPIDEDFWKAAARGELVIQRCAQCLAPRFPPRAMCPECQSLERDWVPATGRGSVWSFAIPRPPLLPAFEALVPYVTALVALDDAPGLRMVGLLVNEDGDISDEALASNVTIGARVEVTFKRLSDDVALPCWQLAGTGEG